MQNAAPMQWKRRYPEVRIREVVFRLSDSENLESVADVPSNLLQALGETTTVKDKENLEGGGLVKLPVRADTFAQLQKLAGARKQSVLAYLSDAVSLQLWFDEQLKDGGKIITKPRHGKAEVITARR